MKTVLRLIAISLWVGGLVRLFADRTVFELFSIGDLWPEHPYSLYVYRCLAGFVVFTGTILFVASSDPNQYRRVILACAAGFGLLGFVMLVAGYMIGISLDHYAPDFLYCFVVSIALFIGGRRAGSAVTS